VAASLQVVAKSGTVKKIKASDIARTMSSDACWFSGHASTVSVNDYISLTSEEYVIIESGEAVDLKFIPDNAGSNGQGLSIPTGLQEIKVIAVNGTCKGLRAEKAVLTTTKTDAYSSADNFNLSANDILERSDMAVCDKGVNSYITLRFTAFPTYGPYASIAAARLYTDDR
jgi:hypothetical protein